MAYVSLNLQAPVQLPVTEISWKLTSMREFGTATIIVPRTSLAFTTSHLPKRGSSHRGGFLVSISCGYDLPTWVGIAEKPTLTEEGATVTATHIASLVKRMTVGYRSFTAQGGSVAVGGVVVGSGDRGGNPSLLGNGSPGNLTGGMLIRIAMQDVTSGRPTSLITVGRLSNTSKSFPSYEFRGQSLSDVLADVMETTGVEWEIDTDYKLNVGPPISRLHPNVFCEGGDLYDLEIQSPATEEVAIVKARTTTGEIAVAVDAELFGESLLASDIWVSAGEGERPDDVARRELARHRFPANIYTAFVRTIHWADIRLGDIIQVVSPYKGVTFTSRVLSLSYSESDSHLQVTLQEMVTTTDDNANRISQQPIPLPQLLGRGIYTGISSTSDSVDTLHDRVDETIYNMVTRNIPARQIIDSVVTAVNNSGDNIAAAAIRANLPSAFNASAGGYDASRVTTGSLPQGQMQTNVVPAINAAGSGVSAAVITTGNLAAAQMQTNLPTAFNAGTGYSATSITTGSLPQSQMQTNVVSAVNAAGSGMNASVLTIGDVAQARLTSNVVGAINSVGTGINAGVLSTGDVAAARLQTNVVSAINSAGTGLNASVISTGDISANRMQTNVVSAINSSGTGVNAAVISTGDLAALRMQTNLTTAFNATSGFDASKLTTGDLSQARMQTNVISAVNAAGDIAAARIQTNLPTAFNATTGFSAASLTTGSLPQARMEANVVGAINAVGTGVSAAVISTGDIAAARMQTNLPTAFNAVTGFSAAQLTTGKLPSARVTSGGTVANSSASDVATLVSDFNSLLSTLRTAGIIS